MRIFLLSTVVWVLLMAFSSTCHADWTPYTVQQTNGRSARIDLQARFQVIDQAWSVPAKIPFVEYMPEKDRLIVLMGNVVSFSSDHGATWSAPSKLREDLTESLLLGMSYLGKGKLMTLSGMVSFDYGNTWRQMRRVPFVYEAKTIHGWDPFFVSTDKDGNVVKLMETGYTCVGDTPSGGAAQAYMRTSTDEGRTWSDAVKVPEWEGVNEVTMVRAKNGDLVAACRTVVPQKFINELDLFEGLAVSISKDDGKTWSKISKLYDYGRHHARMVVMPDGEIVMSYAVRSGYSDSADGRKRYGIEAIVSRDNGKTWDLDHKYILATWTSKITGGNAWWPFAQATSTALLPDGSLLTAYGSGKDVEVSPDGQPTGRHVGLVHWSLNNRGLNKDRDIRDAAVDSDLRNVFEP